MPDLVRRKDPQKFRTGIDPAWWCVPIATALGVGVLFFIFEYDGSDFERQPIPQALEQGRPEKRKPEADIPEKRDSYLELAEELKRGGLKTQQEK